MSKEDNERAKKEGPPEAYDLDAKYSMSIWEGRKVETAKRTRDIEKVNRELDRRNEERVKNYMENLYDKPAVLPKDQLSQHITQSVSEGLDPKSIERISEGLNPKISKFMVQSVMTKWKAEKMERKYGPVFGSFFRGKVGFDVFFVLFSVVGLVAIPSYFMVRQYRVREFMKANNIAPVSLEDLESEGNQGIDIDDISRHVTFYDQSEFKQRMINKIKVENEIAKLDGELYGGTRKQKEEYLFGNSKK